MSYGHGTDRQRHRRTNGHQFPIMPHFGGVGIVSNSHRRPDETGHSCRVGVGGVNYA